MSLMANLCKHYKRSDVEKGSRFDPPAIPFIPKAITLKMDNVQEFNLCVSLISKQSTYKFKAHMFSNGITKDPIKTAKSKFDLVEAMLEGNAPTHWQEFKCIKIVWIPKNLEGTDGVAPGISMDTYK
eukprot:10530255-Ditylum_brightwellii.AAC.1